MYILLNAHCLNVYAVISCMLDESAETEKRASPHFGTAGDMIAPVTPVGCNLLPLAKQSLCYLRENELLNILRLNRLILK